MIFVTELLSELIPWKLWYNPKSVTLCIYPDTRFEKRFNLQVENRPSQNTDTSTMSRRPNGSKSGQLLSELDGVGFLYIRANRHPLQWAITTRQLLETLHRNGHPSIGNPQNGREGNHKWMGAIREMEKKVIFFVLSLSVECFVVLCWPYRLSIFWSHVRIVSCVDHPVSIIRVHVDRLNRFYFVLSLCETRYWWFCKWYFF